MNGLSFLKENIRHYLSDLLNFEVIEIRLLEHATGNLVPAAERGHRPNRFGSPAIRPPQRQRCHGLCGRQWDELRLPGTLKTIRCSSQGSAIQAVRSRQR